MGQQPLQYSFFHYTTTSGLVSNQVNTVVQDDDGFMWMGTTEGLQRFDGTRYRGFRHMEGDSSSIPSNPVWQLLVDKKKNLWLLMSDGTVGIFNTKTFRFQPVKTEFKKQVTPNTSLKRLIIDEFGNLFYLLSGSEVITLNKNRTAFSYKYNFFKQQLDWEINDFIHQPGTDKYWISIKNGGLACYNNATSNISYAANNNEHESLVDYCEGKGSYYNLFFDKQQRLWYHSFITMPSINCYDLVAKQAVIKDFTFASHLKTYHDVKGFSQQRDGTVWVNGLFVFAKYVEAKKQFQLVYNGYLNDQSIAYEMVHAVCEDREGNVWVGTNNNGLYRFNPATQFFHNIRHTNRYDLSQGKGSPMSFMETAWGTLLCGTWGDGLYEYDKDFNQIPVSIKKKGQPLNLFAWCMVRSADTNKIWMSAQPGIFLIDQAKRSYTVYNPPILQSKTIRQIAEDKNGNLWLGMNSTGVFKWTAEKGKQKFEDGVSAIKAVPPVQINKITIDSKGYVWIGTPENGLFVLDAATDSLAMRFSENSTQENKLPERGISSILEYNDSLVIITTATRVFCYNRLLKRSYLIGSAGAISGFITAVEKDSNGYLWLTSTSGLYRININRRVVIKFGRADGLDNEQFVQSASYKFSDGRMAFGTTDNMVVFNPTKINIVSAPPEIKVTGFKVTGSPRLVDSIMQLKEVELGYQDNSLAIEFSALVYNSAYLIMYKMDKLDKDWKTADNNNEAVYSYLPPGEYTFLLKTVDEEGRESDKITRLNITVHPPFWKTWWFYSLLFLGITLLLFWLDRERMKRKEAIQKMRSDIADDLYRDINTALGNINILSEMAKLKADKDPEKSKEFIQQINSKSQQMIVALDDMLWGISPDNDSMEQTIERVKEHIHNLRHRYQVEINLLVDKNVLKLKLNMKERQNMFWFFKNGITNIVRSGGTNCKIHISCERGYVTYLLEFDNSQTDMQQLNNILQRQELAKKLEEVKATFKIQHNVRSVIELKLPVG